MVVSLSLALFSEGGKGKLSPHLVLILVIYIMAMASWGCKEGEREREREDNKPLLVDLRMDLLPPVFSLLGAVADCVCVWFCGQTVVFGWCPFTGLKGDVWGKDHPNGELVSLPGHSGHAWFPSCYAVIRVWDLCSIAS